MADKLLTREQIIAAAQSSIEGIAIQVVYSLEFSLQRDLTDGQIQHVYTVVKEQLSADLTVSERPHESLLPAGDARDVAWRRGAITKGWQLCRRAILGGKDGD